MIYHPENFVEIDGLLVVYPQMNTDTHRFFFDDFNTDCLVIFLLFIRVHLCASVVKFSINQHRQEAWRRWLWPSL